MAHESCRADPVTPSRRDVWIGMLLYPRHTLPTAAAPVLVAAGLARHDGVFAWQPALAAFLAGWLVQLGGVIADNYHNVVRHADDREHPAFIHALRTGVVALAELRRTIAACYLAAIVAGASLVYVGGLPALLVGLASIAASLAYSSAPYPLGDHALGDLLFFVFFGVVSVTATYYVQAAAVLGPPFPLAVPAGAASFTALVASLPIGALTTNILVIDNIRDLDFDREKGETTLAVLIGARWSRAEYVAVLLLAYAVPLWFWTRPGFGPGVLLPLLSAPYAALVARWVIRARTHDELVPMTPQAGQVLLAYAALLGLGFAV
ncbi:MAG: 1,4-dihydroxy-2-naphthoate octaprenyltransferase [Candidatus Rokubacteria bacterium]|nr:1,4-dihydroxy-2-naphthoate octaprenyltransferase [Candidatus Rokubacteria bacterium]